MKTGIIYGLLIGMILPGAVQAQSIGKRPSRKPVAVQSAEEVTFYGKGGSISGGVIVPAGRKMLFTSGTVPDEADPTAKAGERARYGDTRTQAISALKNIEKQLKEQGLSLKDVIYLRAYLVPDPEKGNKMDFKGWNEAYGQFFNTRENPTKVARSTIAVAGLYDPDLLFEVEAVAVFPQK